MYSTINWLVRCDVYSETESWVDLHKRWAGVCQKPGRHLCQRRFERSNAAESETRNRYECEQKLV